MNRAVTAAEAAALPVARDSLANRLSFHSVAETIVLDLGARGHLRVPGQPEPAPGLDEIRQREAGAWRGPWTVTPVAGSAYMEITTPDGPVAHVNVHLAPSADFIAGARQDIPDLLAAIDGLQAATAASAEAFARLYPQQCARGAHRDWFADSADGPLPCPWCRIAVLEAALAAPPAVFWPVRDDAPIGDPYSTREAAAAEAETVFRVANPGLACEWRTAEDDPAVIELVSDHGGHTSATGYAVRSVPVHAGDAEEVKV